MFEKLLLSVAGDRQTVLKSNFVIFRCFTLKISGVKCISAAHVVNKSFSTGEHSLIIKRSCLFETEVVKKSRIWILVAIK